MRHFQWVSYAIYISPYKHNLDDIKNVVIFLTLVQKIKHNHERIERELQEMLYDKQ